MAVIEIAKIQVRRGQEQQSGIPQLAGGEFAWAEDTENLYIGLKREDGGARDANVRVLTENDVRLFNSFIVDGSTATNYTWQLVNAQTITSQLNTYPTRVQRTIQRKLDDVVSAGDFGIEPSASSSTDSANKLQTAIDHLFLNQHVGSPGSDYDTTSINTYNKKLVIPAGVYYVGGPIFIPKNTILVGEGIDKTIIECLTTTTSLFKTVDYHGRRGDSSHGDSNTYQGEFDETVTTIFGDGQPKNIHIEGMTVRFSSALSHSSLLSLDCVSGAVIKQVKFQGNHSAGSTSESRGIDLRGYANGGITTENIVIEDCEFTGLYSDIKSDYDVNNIVVQNNNFNNSAYSIALSSSTNVQTTTGPRSVRIANNKFKDIENQAIFVGANVNGWPTNHVSQNNSFIEVGNDGNDELSPVTSVIHFGTMGNSSVNDYFERQNFHNQNFGTTTNYVSLISGKGTLDLNSISTATLFSGPPDTETTFMRLPLTGESQYLTLKYKATGTGIDKLGTLHVYVRPPIGVGAYSTTTSVLIEDDYQLMVSDGGIYWGVRVDTSTNSFEVLGVNPQLVTDVNLEYQTKLML